MEIQVNVDALRLIEGVRNAHKRIAYAAVNAINNTAKRIQKTQRRRVRRRFTVRKGKFIERQAAIIKPFASVKKGLAYAEISVGEKPRLLLGHYEAGGTRPKLSKKGHRIAVPVKGSPARPTFKASVPPALQIGKLRLKKVRRKRRKGAAPTGAKPPTLLRGLQSTYLIAGVGLFQRKSPEETELLYGFKESQRLKRRLGFLDTAERVAAKYFDKAIEAELTDVMRRHGLL